MFQSANFTHLFNFSLLPTNAKACLDEGWSFLDLATLFALCWTVDILIFFFILFKILIFSIGSVLKPIAWFWNQPGSGWPLIVKTRLISQNYQKLNRIHIHYRLTNQSFSNLSGSCPKAYNSAEVYHFIHSW